MQPHFDLTYHLKELERKRPARRKGSNRDPHKKRRIDPETPARGLSLPKRTGKTDPTRVPAENQPEDEKIALQYLLVSHTTAVPRMGNSACDKSEARKIAEHLVDLAREEGADFAALAKRFSDSLDYRIPLLIRDTETSETLMPCFRLKPGQITDPIDTLKGFMVFKRVELELIESVTS